MRSVLRTTTVCRLLLLSGLSSCSWADESLSGVSLFTYCAGCHLVTGEGAPGLIPPLTGQLGPLTRNQSGRDYLVMVISAGLIGPIKVSGITYKNLMPPQGMTLTNNQIATVLNYVLQTFNQTTLPDEWMPFSSAEVGAILARYPEANSQSVHTLRLQAFEEDYHE